MTTLTTTYDQLPYFSVPFAWTHPDRLATLGRLFGLRPPPVDQCRVLELGCGRGGNLIPMALDLPGSQFLGIDLSRRQVEEAQARIKVLSATNIQVEPLSILDIGPDLGMFDYIICHGVYSWVPENVREKILAICSNQLTADGLAYVSYNTYPGWYVRRMIRDMLCRHASPGAAPPERMRQARELLEFLGQAVIVREQSVYPSLIRGAAEMFRQRPDTYLLHEYLEEVNEPVYFLEFVERAAAKGLQYVTDTDYINMRAETLASVIQEGLNRLSPDPLRREQYLDFVRNQAFRRSLLCHRQVTPSSDLQMEIMAELQLSSSAQPVPPDVNMGTPGPVSFRASDGRICSVADPLLKTVLAQLRVNWPEAMSFESLRIAVGAGLAPAPALQRALRDGYRAGLIECHTRPPRCVRTAGAHPVASPLARHQAASAAQVTNLRHELVELNELDRHLLRHLDGHHDRAALVEILTDLAVQGVLRLSPQGAVLTDARQIRHVLGEAITPHLARLAYWSLIFG